MSTDYTYSTIDKSHTALCSQTMVKLLGHKHTPSQTGSEEDSRLDLNLRPLIVGML